ncbi:tyrosine aminotransferase [Spizellomyces punctatus DAOM BR117]|uniref:Tyrosine aminotransferase n=1 Tax=Spizellomyces punctatus (strain DAOM BR117) TaxID=645134 RepID=A0A0L0HLJ8_SPIPD|nr:tyrosine aminotransferase [Spizellomyces punctatus DAOM BR117]KND01992.1 tyrosine aminotransferase [Spizellomyces punctatus DAOM BR117]|eukprot:XP_016610031.1 tyrosine aminotransferase [Spizellomyces punctatus DAOM BR117]
MADHPFQIKPSIVSMRTRNPIRAIVDNLKVKPNPEKEFISLALGDPTTFGNFKLHESCLDAVKSQLESYKANGYPPSIGTEQARAAVAQAYTHPQAPLTSADVILASGCSDALNLCIGALANEGQNILLPAPGFSLYETLASSKGIECRFYDLQPHRSWEIDLNHLETLVDENTAAILVNNPSNPCGSVYSKQHLLDILAVAEKHRLPIISDEIYADMAFTGHEFLPISTLTTTVPILTTGGLAKKYLVPGWRVGWVLVHDRNGALEQIRKGLINLSQLILGPNSLVQAALPDILQAPKSFYEQTMEQLERNANISEKLLTGIPGLRPVFPQGAMYLMVEIDTSRFKNINDDLDFVEKLAEEESVLCLPGKCFRCRGNFIRIVFTPPVEKLDIAYSRIRSFCERHLASS